MTGAELDLEDTPGTVAYWKGALCGANWFLVGFVCAAVWTLLGLVVTRGRSLPLMAFFAVFCAGAARMAHIREKTVEALMFAVVQEILES